MPGARIGFGREPLAAFAVDAGRSRGRLYPESPSPTRTEYQRDRDRVLHSTAFRRLKDKTQVFLYDEGDHYRTRLTHTLEVSQIARALARALRLDEDLAEALALAHDLGHTPFGHAGERALNAAMSAFGGFDHNGQSLRVVTSLERRYPRYDGLNLTWETLEGLVKHNGPLTDGAGRAVGRYAERGLPFAIAEYAEKQDLGLSTYASAEAQAAAIADDIAYNAHDIDDGLRAGLLTLEGLGTVELPARLLSAIKTEHPGISADRTTHELIRRLITVMIEDVIGESLRNLDALAPSSTDAIRQASGAVIGFSESFRIFDRDIKARLETDVYRHRRVMGVMERAETLVLRLFERYRSDQAAMPHEWRCAPGSSEAARARRAADFLAGMTDRFAIGEYRRLFDEDPELG